MWRKKITKLRVSTLENVSWFYQNIEHYIMQLLKFIITPVDIREQIMQQIPEKWKKLKIICYSEKRAPTGHWPKLSLTWRTRQDKDKAAAAADRLVMTRVRYILSQMMKPVGCRWLPIHTTMTFLTSFSYRICGSAIVAILKLCPIMHHSQWTCVFRWHCFVGVIRWSFKYLITGLNRRYEGVLFVLADAGNDVSSRDNTTNQIRLPDLLGFVVELLNRRVLVGGGSSVPDNTRSESSK